MGGLHKYGFRIKTRHGLILENLSVQARDREEAERKIKQIYHHCEILTCGENTTRRCPTDVEGVIALISETPEAPLALRSTGFRPAE